MDPSSDPPPRSRSRGESRSRALAHIDKRRDYLIGILLLLCVVVLWTTSNFVTQVCSIRWIQGRPVTLPPRICSKTAMRNHSCMFPPLRRLETSSIAHKVSHISTPVPLHCTYSPSPFDGPDQGAIRMPKAVGRSTGYAKFPCAHVIASRREAYEPLLTHADAAETLGITVRLWILAPIAACVD